jgi:DNA-binding transcriptional regulator YhcF (GntR family)
VRQDLQGLFGDWFLPNEHDSLLPVTEFQPPIVETLRGRVLRGLQAGTLGSGDRLPSARELVAEFDVDHRLILAAYRQLTDEGLVEVRERGGVYVAAASSRNAHAPALPVKWFVDAFTEAFAREIPAPELSEWLRRSVETLRLRAVVISSTEDQVGGLARELRDDFGLEAEGIAAPVFSAPGAYPAALKRADLLIATTAHADLVTRLAEELGKPCVTIHVRPDLVLGEWAMLLRHPVWAVVATPEFGDMLRHFFANVRGIENLRILVHGRDDLSQIPDGAPTYVTHRVRQALGATPMRGRVLPAARTISVESARQIFDFIVRANIRALLVVHEPPPSTAGAAAARAW